MKFKFLSSAKINSLPKSPGVYAFKDGREFLYIGKAANLKERVKNHFERPSFQGNFFINKAERVGFLKTDSEIEALILEANLIKKYRPKYNVVWRDDKNYFYVGITKEDFPRIFITHQPKPVSCILYPVSSIKSKKIQNTKYKIRDTDYVGPFVDGTALKKVLRILRRIFPYYSAKKHPKALCSWCQLGFCPGPNPKKKDYQKNIRNLIATLKGKKGIILEKLRKEMKLAAKLKSFEKAAKIRDQIFSLEKIWSHSKVIDELEEKGGKPSLEEWQETERGLKILLKTKRRISRIEALDVSNIQGKLAAGSVVTFVRGVPDKNFYRKFKIHPVKYSEAGAKQFNRVKIAGKPDDIAMIKEVLSRRFNHPEWPYPDLILIDGGKAQLNAALNITNQYKSALISVLALAKKENKLFIENEKEPILLKNLPRQIFNLILQLRDEAHRFAIFYHRKLRNVSAFR